MRLLGLSPEELAARVDEVFLADHGDFYSRSSQDLDTLQQLRVYLSGRPALADEVLQAWLQTIQGDEASEMRQEAEDWYDQVLLGGLKTH